MKSSSTIHLYQPLIRASGLLFLLFGLLAILLRLTQFLLLGDPPLEILAQSRGFLIFQAVPGLLAGVSFILGAAALYLVQADQLGKPGLVIFLMAFFCLVISTGALWAYAFAAPDLARGAPEILTSPTSGLIRGVLGSLLLGQVGWLALVLISLKGDRVPCWSLLTALGAILAVAALTPFASSQLLRLIYNILLSAGPMAVGYALWRGNVFLQES